MISTRVMDVKLREAAEGLGEDSSGKKKSKFKTFKKLFGKKKRKESPSSTGSNAWKQSQVKSEVITAETGPVGYDSEDELEDSRGGALGSRALSHDSIFIPESGQDPARPVRVFSQENVCDRIKALQLKIQCNVKMGPPPPGGLPVKRGDDTGMSSEDDGLPRSPPEMSLLHEVTPSTTIKVSLAPSPRLAPRLLTPDHLFCRQMSEASVLPRTPRSSLAPVADFDYPPEFSSCLDNSAAKHKLLVKPRNQRSSKMRRLSSRAQSESLSYLLDPDEEDYEEKPVLRVSPQDKASSRQQDRWSEPGALGAMLQTEGPRARRARLQHSPALRVSGDEESTPGDQPPSRPATPEPPAPHSEPASLREGHPCSPPEPDIQPRSLGSIHAATGDTRDAVGTPPSPCALGEVGLPSITSTAEPPIGPVGLDPRVWQEAELKMEGVWKVAPRAPSPRPPRSCLKHRAVTLIPRVSPPPPTPLEEPSPGALDSETPLVSEASPPGVLKSEQADITLGTLRIEQVETLQSTSKTEQVEIPKAEQVETPQSTPETVHVETLQDTPKIEQVELPQGTLKTEQVETLQGTPMTEQVETPLRTLEIEQVESTQVILKTEQEETLQRVPKIKQVGTPQGIPKTDQVENLQGIPNTEQVETPQEIPNTEQMETPQGTPKIEQVETPQGIPKTEQMETSLGTPKTEQMETPQGIPKTEQVETPQGIPKTEQVELPQGIPKTEQMETPQGTLKTEQVETPQGIPKTEQVKTPQSIPKTEQMETPQGIPKTEKVKTPQWIPKTEQVETPQGIPKTEQVELPQGIPKTEQMETPQGTLKTEQVETPQGIPKTEQVKTPQGIPKTEQMETPQGIPKTEQVETPQGIPKIKQVGTPQVIPKNKQVGIPQGGPKTEQVGTPQEAVPAPEVDTDQPRGPRFSVSSSRAPPPRVPGPCIRLPLARSGPAWKSEAALDHLQEPPGAQRGLARTERGPADSGQPAAGRSTSPRDAAPREPPDADDRGPFPVKLRSTSLSLRHRDAAAPGLRGPKRHSAEVRPERAVLAQPSRDDKCPAGGVPAPSRGARSPNNQRQVPGKGRSPEPPAAKPPLPRKPLLQTLTLQPVPAPPDADASPGELERDAPGPRKERKPPQPHRAAEKAQPCVASGPGADSQPAPPWITITRHKRQRGAPDLPPEQEDRPGARTLRSETGKQVKEPMKQVDFVRSKSFLITPAKPAGDQDRGQGTKLRLQEGLQRGISLSHQNLAQAAMMTEKELHQLKRASYTSTDQPSWMELARKKSQAWSDMPQIIK